MTGIGDYDCKPEVILKIFSLKKVPNIFALSTTFV